MVSTIQPTKSISKPVVAQAAGDTAAPDRQFRLRNYIENQFFRFAAGLSPEEFHALFSALDQRGYVPKLSNASDRGLHAISISDLRLNAAKAVFAGDHQKTSMRAGWKRDDYWGRCPFADAAIGELNELPGILDLSGMSAA